MRHDFIGLLEVTIKAQASDLHLNAEAPPMVRQFGKLKIILDQDSPLSDAEVHKYAKEAFACGPDRHRLEFEETGSTVMTIEVAKASISGRFRVSLTKSRGVPKIVARRLATTVPTIEELRLPEGFKRAIVRPHGLILVCGSTGSGKSTTLAAACEFLTRVGNRHIVTVERPVEYRIGHGRASIVAPREVGVDVASFEQGLHDALRMDPNVIVIGEAIRPHEMRTAIEAAETGHMVFTTVHANNCQTVVGRVLDQYSGSEQAEVRSKLASSLVAVICQVLVPTKDKQGRRAAFEFMWASTNVRAMIRKGNTAQIPSAIQTGRKFGMMLKDESLFNLWNSGECAAEDVLQFAESPEELSGRIQKKMDSSSSSPRHQSSEEDDEEM